MSDQLSTHGTKVIVVTQPEAAHVLDEILGNQTDLPIAEHATDTAGASLVNFALFDLVGKQFSPRIRDLGGITLCRTATKAAMAARYPHAGKLLTRRANADLVAEHWGDLLRLAASLTLGHATASLVVAKLSASGPQNTLAAALKEYGLLRRHHLRRPLPLRRGVPTKDLPPVEQGQKPARSTPRPLLRP